MNIKQNIINEIINNKIFMSPMAGVSDIPFRLLIQKYGCRFTFTEMIDANGLFYNNWKTFQMLERSPEEKTHGVQIVGEDKNRLINAAKICEDKGFKVLELNASCPVKKIVNDNKGAALLKDLKKLGRIINGITRKINIPLIVKIRSGWNIRTINYLETAKAIESCGASAICIHPRTKKQMFSGLPNHNITRIIKESVKIPVFASGNIFTPKDVEKIFNETNCDAIAIARGALGNPWIFKDIYDYMSDKTKIHKIVFEDIKNIIEEHINLCFKYYKGKRVFSRMHKHMQWYLKGFKNRHNIMKAYREIKTLEQFNIFNDSLFLDKTGKLYFNSRIQDLNKVFLSSV